MATTAFEWSRAGWFGGQIGATIRPLFLGIGVFAHTKPLGALLVALAVIPNGVGIALWRRRSALAPYKAIQILIAVCGAAALLALICVEVAGLPESALGLAPPWFLLVYPALMYLFHRHEQRARDAA